MKQFNLHDECCDKIRCRKELYDCLIAQLPKQVVKCLISTLHNGMKEASNIVGLIIRTGVEEAA